MVGLFGVFKFVIKLTYFNSRFISLSISLSYWTMSGANIPMCAPYRATSSSVNITCFSFFLETKSSVSNMTHSLIPDEW